MIGTKLGRYEIIDKLGAGGMGVVYRAHDSLLQRDVALKVLAPHLLSDPSALEDFLSEARAAARLSHPNIVTVYEAGEQDGYAFISTELVEGGDLREKLERSGRFTPQQTCTIVQAIASALDYSHSQAHPVIHRDIKPANILLTTDGRPKVADFGIAKVQGDISRTGTGMLKGTLAYMAPELFDGVKPDPKTDQWSLGVLAYELLTGCHPFADNNNSIEGQLTVIMKIAKADPPRVLIDSEYHNLEDSLDNSLRKVLSRDPFKRYDNCGAFAADLDRTVNPTLVQRVPRWLIGIAAILLLAVIALIAMRPYEPPAEFDERLLLAGSIANDLSTTSAVELIFQQDYLDVKAEQLRQLRSISLEISDMNIPPRYQSQGYYFMGLEHYFKSLHFDGVNDQARLNGSIEQLAHYWLRAKELGLPKEYPQAIRIHLDQFNALTESSARPSCANWNAIMEAFSN